MTQDQITAFISEPHPSGVVFTASFTNEGRKHGLSSVRQKEVHHVYLSGTLGLKSMTVGFDFPTFHDDEREYEDYLKDEMNIIAQQLKT